MAKEGHKSLTIKNLKNKSFGQSDAKVIPESKLAESKGGSTAAAAAPAYDYQSMHASDDKAYADNDDGDKKSYK
jgi:hypothetical protein